MTASANWIRTICRHCYRTVIWTDDRWLHEDNLGFWCGEPPRPDFATPFEEDT